MTHKPYVIVAGSGPSAKTYKGRADIATKKFTVEADYFHARHPAWRDRAPKTAHDKPMLLYEIRNDRKSEGFDWDDAWVANTDYWNGYFAAFNPRFGKASLGTTAVFCAYEYFQPEKIGLIGLDKVLDGEEKWIHDAEAEREAIFSLPVEIIDLRLTDSELNDESPRQE